MAKAAAEVGSTANRYEILAKLAAGGMADIFLARGVSVAGVERYCVLKRILRARANDAQVAQMFLDEARLAAQLQHPNIASVYDVGKLGDSYFFTMEYVHGETVRSLLARSTAQRRPVPLACALTIVAGAAAGLHHAHERNGVDGRALGIVHRDVSPSNLMVSYEGNIKVVDFGVAKAEHRAIETRSGTVKGKISYLSPEQCRGERVDRRSDLFSLGIVMWEMLTGQRLYRRESDFANMTAIVNEGPVPPSVCRPDVSPEVDDIVLRLLAKAPEARFQGADEVVDRIEVVAIRAGLMLSTSAVSRFVRELFGRRPEPWLDLDPNTIPYEPISLTGGSVSTDSALASVDLIELELAKLSELSSAGGRVEIDERGEGAEVGIDERGQGGRVGIEERGEPGMAASMVRPPHPGSPSIAPGDAPVIATQPPPARVQAGLAASPRSPRWLRISLLGGAAVAGLLALWFAMQLGAGVPANATSPDASGSAMATPGGAGSTAAPDAAPVVVERHTAPPDAALLDGDMSVDAGPEVPRAAPPEPDLQARLRVDLLNRFKQGKYASIVATCRPKVTPEIADVCVRAACEQGDGQLADRWVLQIPGAKVRADTAAECQRVQQKRAEDLEEFVGCAARAMSERDAPRCTQAACRTRNTERARKWVRLVPVAGRSDLVEPCKALGIDLATEPDCTVDARACP